MNTTNNNTELNTELLLKYLILSLNSNVSIPIDPEPRDPRRDPRPFDPLPRFEGPDIEIKPLIPAHTGLLDNNIEYIDDVDYLEWLLKKIRDNPQLSYLIDKLKYLLRFLRGNKRIVLYKILKNLYYSKYLILLNLTKVLFEVYLCILICEFINLSALFDYYWKKRINLNEPEYETLKNIIENISIILMTIIFSVMNTNNEDFKKKGYEWMFLLQNNNKMQLFFVALLSICLIFKDKLINLWNKLISDRTNDVLYKLLFDKKPYIKPEKKRGVLLIFFKDWFPIILGSVLAVGASYIYTMILLSELHTMLDLSQVPNSSKFENFLWNNYKKGK